ncbi:MAG TPA: TetR family transcriptional regulator [Solirubrobacteraceae bacterium]|nr:TetR family transcriptional regulator [Solirubrobacteraceae bacterium]
METPEGAEQLGLRERKKRRTRGLIAETARRLFFERGFEATTVSDIAREAEVAEQTVFNYFPTKEDLFYSGLEAFEAELLATVGERKRGESALSAFARFVLKPRGVFAMEEAGPAEATRQLQEITRVVTDSPALLAREREIFARYAASLAQLLADETGVDSESLEPWVAAHALMGAHRATIDYVRRRTLAGAGVSELARELPQQTRLAIESLERGFGGYAVKV